MPHPAPTPVLDDPLTPAAVARRIQHTLISIDLTAQRLARHCEQCVTYGFDAAMVPANWVARGRDLLSGTGVKVASAVDFPLGSMTTAGKVAEIGSLVSLGVDEIDVAPSTGHLLSGDVTGYADDLAQMVRAAGAVPIKVMLELPLLPAHLRDTAVDAAVDAGVTWVKNASSGAVGPATPALVSYLRSRVPTGVGVKASGGITSYAQACALLAAGAQLLGTSAGVAIVTATGDADGALPDGATAPVGELGY